MPASQILPQDEQPRLLQPFFGGELLQPSARPRGPLWTRSDSCTSLMCWAPRPGCRAPDGAGWAVLVTELGRSDPQTGDGAVPPVLAAEGNLFSRPAGHTASERSQDAPGLLGRLGTLMAGVTSPVHQDPKSLSAGLLALSSSPALYSRLALPRLRSSTVPLAVSKLVLFSWAHSSNLPQSHSLDAVPSSSNGDCTALLGVLGTGARRTRW